MSGNPVAWADDLSAEIEHHRPTLGWLVPHLQALIGPAAVDVHLLSLGSDLCDAGHIHLDIVLWLLCDDGLRTVIVSEEHYDTGPESVDTTFDTTVSTHPFDTIAGTQLSSVSHPDGTQVDIQLAVMLSTPGHTGHADPLPYGSDDGPSYAIAAQPAPMVFIADATRTAQVSSFAQALSLARTPDWQ